MYLSYGPVAWRSSYQDAHCVSLLDSIEKFVKICTNFDANWNFRDLEKVGTIFKNILQPILSNDVTQSDSEHIMQFNTHYKIWKSLKKHKTATKTS